ncbi:MAG: tRNA (adenosine(37)-N6)-threonylcarbamoyltransferase complex ATPase subunit type 1 TsaE [Candidatus Harrisonbacteria bacterium]|nr:tRNA (adenosine(37)-N6)-threonylcarbamoyltransferase complex ATPase subunit type 1 TsaE [Candidatus Harrisonbacteria bacterium]
MLSKSKLQTQKLAVRFAKKILRSSQDLKLTKVIALRGDLGTGKTTFTQGFMGALGVRHRVTSPTFLIVRKYEISTPIKRGFIHFHHAYHFDLYRIQKPKELLDLGFKKIISDPHNILLIEWPERVKKILPKDTIWIEFEHGKSEKERIITVTSD